MILKGGPNCANPLGMQPEIVPAIIVANEVYGLHGHNLVVTSICDGKHSKSSYHYKGLAIDCRTHYFKSKTELYKVAEDIRGRLGPLYDVVVESDHIHIEFDEKRAIAAMENQQ